MMKNNEIKIFYVIITIIAVLGVLLASYSLHNKYLVEKPLTEKLLAIEGVEKVDINKIDKESYICIQISQVDNIQKSYGKIESMVEDSINSNYRIEIKDKRNQKLDRLYDDLQPAIYQGLAQKEFLWLNEQIREQSSKKDIDSRLLVDDKRLYLQLKDGDSYLYRIIEQGAVEKETGRGRDN